MKPTIDQRRPLAMREARCDDECARVARRCAAATFDAAPPRPRRRFPRSKRTLIARPDRHHRHVRLLPPFFVETAPRHRFRYSTNAVISPAARRHRAQRRVCLETTQRTPPDAILPDGGYCRTLPRYAI